LRCSNRAVTLLMAWPQLQCYIRPCKKWQVLPKLLFYSHSQAARSRSFKNHYWLLTALIFFKAWPNLQIWTLMSLFIGFQYCECIFSAPCLYIQVCNETILRYNFLTNVILNLLSWVASFDAMIKEYSHTTPLNNLSQKTITVPHSHVTV